MTIPELLRQWAEATPNAPALLAPGRRPLTYARLYDLTQALARQLRSLGVRPDDRVAIVAQNGPELAVSFLAVASTAVAAPLNPAYRVSELDFYLADLGAKAIIMDEPPNATLRLLLRHRVVRLLELERSASGEAGALSLSAGGRGRGKDGGPGATALMLHTSGTTARPKRVSLTHKRLCLSAENIARSLELTADDRCLNVMPLFHIHGLVGALLSSLSAGSSIVCAPGFHAPSFHGWLSELEPTWYTAVPAMHQAVIARRPDGTETTSLRFVRSSSAPLPSQVHQALEQAFGVPVIEAYGMTEGAHQLASNPLPPAARKPGSVGLATGVDIAVRDDGEIVVRGETVFDGYDENPEANAEAFVDGWFRTGDEGSFDEDGYLFLKGRSKEIINRAGEKIAPAEIESVLLAHPLVDQAVGFAVPDPLLGEDVGAAVVLRPGAAASVRDLQEHVAERLADFKVPRIVVTVDELPTGPTGKVQRRSLAQQFGLTGAGASHEQAAYVEPATPLEREMAALWAEVLEVERVGAEDDFFALGGDSILAAEVLAHVADSYEGAPSAAIVMWESTLRAFCAALEDGRWDDDSAIVPLQSGGSRPPLFVVHGLMDEVLNVAALKRSLGADQPLYAIRARPDRLSSPSVERLAERYLEEIRAVHGGGSYLFAGMCSGVALVVELTRRARSQGEEVPLAIGIDPRSDYGLLGFAADHMRRGVRHARAGRLELATRQFARDWGSDIWRRRRPGRRSPEDALAGELARLRRTYRLRPLPGTLTVLTTMDYAFRRDVWLRLADEVRWHEVPVPHATSFLQPHADVLGNTIAEIAHEALEPVR